MLTCLGSWRWRVATVPLAQRKQPVSRTSADRVKATAVDAGGQHQQDDPGNAQGNANQGLSRRPLRTGKQPFPQQDPDRNGGRDHSRKARGHFLLRPEKAAIAAGKHDQAKHSGADPLLPVRLRYPLGAG